MNLQENIRRVLKESVAPQVRRRHEEFDRIFKTYRDSFKDHPYRTFESFWNLLMESSLETLYHAWFSKTVSDDDWEESAEYIEKYLIKKYYDDTKQMWEKKHRNRINESEDDNGKYLKVVKAIANDYKNEDFVCDIDVRYYRGFYEVGVKIDKKEFEKKYENEDISYANILMTEYLKTLQKTIRQEIKYSLPVDVMVWINKTNCEKTLNESEDNEDKNIEKNLRLITKLLETIDVDGLCKMWVEYNPEDGDYEIRSKTTTMYYDMAGMVEELGYIEDTLRSWKLKTYVFSPYYVENCEDEVEFMNESIRKVLREESNIPQPGESSGKPLSQQEMGDMDCDTEYLTIDEILDGRIQRIPYYREVLEDVLNDDYSWGVTKKVVEYARYMKRNPKSLRNLPPIIVVDDVIQDGAHRISAIYLLQNYMDKNNPLWDEIELEVKFCYTI